MKLKKAYRTGGNILPPVTVTGHKDPETRQFYDGLKKEDTDAYQALTEMGREYGFSKIKMKDNLDASGSYNHITNTINIKKRPDASFTNDKVIYEKGDNRVHGNVAVYLAELAHKKQFDQHPVKSALKWLGNDLIDYIKTPFQGDDLRKYSPYLDPKAIEYDAHEVIEPKLNSEFNTKFLRAATYSEGGPMKLKKLYAEGGELKPGAMPSGASIGNKDFDTIPSYLYYIRARQENNQEGMNRSLAHVNETRGPQVATRLQFLGKSMGNSNINDIAKRSVGTETDPQMKLLYSHINENPDAVSKFDMYMPRDTKDIATTPQPVTDGLKKVYATGGQLSSQEKMSAITGGITTGLGAIGGIADALDTPNEYGRQSTGTTVVKNAAQFAGMGATLGPIGAGVGALVGAGVGLLSANKAKRAEDLAKEQAAGAQYRATMQQGQAMVSADPNLVNGYKGAGYYRNGGDLTNLKRILSTKGKQFGHGGSLQNVSQDTELVKGPSHEQGGVQLPGNNEVEGGETIKDGFVFSKALGFAQLHKPIAKKIGLIEGKAPTAERLNSLKRLKSQEDSLALLQEQFKEQNNV